MKNYSLRNIPDPIHEVIVGSGVPTAGRNSQRENWLRTLTCTGALSFLDVEVGIAVYELWQRALQIAKVRRGEEELQSQETVKMKVLLQYDELKKLMERYEQRDCSYLDVVSKASNILYYCVQDFVQNYDLRDFQATSKLVCDLIGLSESAAFRCAAAKYRERAPHTTKNKDRERAAILNVLEDFQIAFKSLDK